MRYRRPSPASRHHLGDGIFGSCKQGLDAPIAAVAHPTLKTEAHRLVLDPGTITDPLHAAADRRAADRGAHRVSIASGQGIRRCAASYRPPALPGWSIPTMRGLSGF